MDSDRILERARWILEEEGKAILRKRDQLGAPFIHLVRKILELPGRVVTTGLGKSGIIAQKISATLSSTGTPAFFLKPVDALHGDLGMLRPGDLLLAISNSGETEEVLAVAAAARGLGVSLAALTGVPASTLGREAEITIDVGVEREACPLGLAPTASTTATLAVGDALAMVLLEERGFTRDHYARFHPGGTLGQRLRSRVRDLMRSEPLLPLVRSSEPLRRALEEMTARDNLGVTLVTDDTGRLEGIITDGDVRRIFLSRPVPSPLAVPSPSVPKGTLPGGTPQDAEAVLSRPVGEVMTRNPKVVESEVGASEALRIMEVKGITSLAVVDALGRPEGILHLHDILGRGKIVI